MKNSDRTPTSALKSPQALELSGIGSKDILKPLGMGCLVSAKI